jgi:hypothetical protein
MHKHNALIAALSFIVMTALFIYPVLYVTFPWTVPVPYLLAFMASIGCFIAALAGQRR